jgi:hypothetical protein
VRYDQTQHIAPLPARPLFHQQRGAALHTATQCKSAVSPRVGLPMTRLFQQSRVIRVQASAGGLGTPRSTRAGPRPGGMSQGAAFALMSQGAAFALIVKHSNDERLALARERCDERSGCQP